MCRLFETIKVLNGAVQNIEFHNKRLNRSRAMLFNRSDLIELRDFIVVPREYREGIIKCRVTYATDIDMIKYERYVKRNISTLKIINCDGIDYAHKYCDRSGIDRLFALRGGCDDIIIVKDNRITESSFCNLVFDDGTKLFTPDTPLMRGTKRNRLIAEGIIVQDRIGLKDLKLFKAVHLINAMLDLNECRVEIDNVHT